MQNYRSAESDPGTVKKILAGMVEADQAWCFDLANAHPPFDHIVANKLGLISKTKADGPVKHRLAWDLRRSGVNTTIAQGERIVLPTV